MLLSIAGLYSTTHDYVRFAQMLLNGGELDGVRIISPSSVKLMSSNLLEEGVPMHFIVGLRLKGTMDRIVVDAEDALAAALKVKTGHPDSVITYVRPQNRRGDARHPSHALAEGIR